MADLQSELFAGSAELTLSDDFNAEKVETFFHEADRAVRIVKTRVGEAIKTSIPRSEDSISRTAAEEFDLAWLRSRERPGNAHSRGTIRLADLFSGCGGISIGIDEAGRALGLDVQHVLAADIVQRNLDVYSRNFAPQAAESRPVEQLIDAPLGAALSDAERELKQRLGPIDFVVGGPPCQGHSDLNNHTRREDPKNALFERMARFAEVIEPTHVVIENVPGVRHDRGRVFDRTVAALSKLGYSVDAWKIPAEELGVAQRRHRTVVVGSMSTQVGDGFLRRMVRQYEKEPRSVGWAISDLLDLGSEHPIDTPTVQSKVSQERIDWLFDNNEYDLPDELRPDCHRTKRHTYKSVYGRLYWDQPAWTITTGFPVMGQGRFLHPLRRRGITPHEAARLQFFPDFFDFGVHNRKGYAQMIGNAVPPKLAYVLALELLR